VNRDGKIAYSAIVLVKSPGATGIAFIDVYPNPVKNLLKIKLASATANKVDIVITDLAGRIIKQQPAKLVAGDNLVEIATASMQAGQYFVKATCSNGCGSGIIKIVKE
jgi:hypothetical protein